MMETTPPHIDVLSTFAQNATTKILPKIQFSWYDYIFFTAMLGTSTIIGIYFGCFGKKQDSTNEYFLGGKNMKVFPVAMSLVSSIISGITLLAVPADIYTYGVNFILCSAMIPWACLVSIYVFIPVFFKCQITSTYEYLELRFDNRLRLISSFLYGLNTFLYLPIVIYVPALAFSQATDINIHLITPLVCSICIFYTTIGGLKAVVWTDALQFFAMVGGMFAVFYKGILSAGGLGEVWRINQEGQRLDLDFGLSFYKRDTVWAVVLGITLANISVIGTSQGAIQKFLSVGSLVKAKRAMLLFAIGMAIIMSCSAFTGLIIYAIYHDCDPYTSGQVQEQDQVLSYYVMDVAKDVPGLPGLFTAGLFCAALSTLSAYLNSMAGTVYEDFVSKFVPNDTSPETIGRILKFIVVCIGVVSTALVFLVEQLGGLLALSISFGGATIGPLMGLFALGMLVPMANAKGAFWGGMSSMIFMLSTMVGSQYYKANGYITYPTKPISTEGCSFAFNTTIEDIIEKNQDDIFFIYRIAHYWYAFIGATVVFIVGLPISWLTRKSSPTVDPDLISPVAQWMIPQKQKDLYYSLEKAANIIKMNGPDVCDVKK